MRRKTKVNESNMRTLKDMEEHVGTQEFIWFQEDKLRSEAIMINENWDHLAEFKENVLGSNNKEIKRSTVSKFPRFINLDEYDEEEEEYEYEDDDDEELENIIMESKRKNKHESQRESKRERETTTRENRMEATKKRKRIVTTTKRNNKRQKK